LLILGIVIGSLGSYYFFIFLLLLFRCMNSWLMAENALLLL
jgi:hypothetical protein